MHVCSTVQWPGNIPCLSPPPPCPASQMVVTNLHYFGALLDSGKPLFTVEALLSAPEVVLHPLANELFKMLKQATIDIIAWYVHSLCHNFSC